MSLRIDLHVHSDASDGSDSPADVVRKASDAGLDVIALTDHDTTAGHAPAAAALRALAGDGRPPLQVVPGAELSCRVDGVSLHMLGYLFDPTAPELAEEMRKLKTDRVRRAEDMVAKLVELGAPVTWTQVARLAGDGSVGRPHVARALVEAGVVPDVASAFVPAWIGTGGRAYVEEYTLDPERAIALVHDAGGVAVFAHPAASSRGDIVAETYIGRLAAAGLDGIEVDHPDHDASTRERLRELGAELGLIVTGSSDYHGSVKTVELGANLTDPEAFDALMSRATGAQVMRV